MSDSYEPDSGPSRVRTAVLVGAVVALLAANVYLYLQIQQVKTDTAKLRESILTEITNLRDASSVTAATIRRGQDQLKTDVESTRRQATVLASNVKSEALSHTDQVARKLAAEQARQEKQVSSQLSEVKEVASTAHSKIAEVNTEVGSVKGEVASTKTELEKTIADLKKVTGDLGVQSGYVATNGKEIAALRRLGERNIIEFKLAKAKEPQRVGDITILLKKSDPKRNKYTVEVFADDKRTEKKDKNINEPIQFYVTKSPRFPYEIVVNEVKKDLIVGYLSTPKDQAARN